MYKSVTVQNKALYKTELYTKKKKYNNIKLIIANKFRINSPSITGMYLMAFVVYSH